MPIDATLTLLFAVAVVTPGMSFEGNAALLKNTRVQEWPLVEERGVLFLLSA